MHPAIPAATLILLRDRPGQPPEIPMVGRGAHLKFAANRMVFPGGRVDDDDRITAQRAELLTEGPEIEADDLAHRIAAIRETVEEIGLAPGIEGIGDVAQLSAVRAALHAGETLSSILARMGLRIDPHGLHPFARWRPDHELSRRFDTRFYIARAPDLGEAMADGIECSHCEWATAQEHIEAGGLIFPTLRNLERLRQIEHYEHAVAFVQRYPIVTVTPWSEDHEGHRWLHIPENLGYPVTRQRLDAVDRDSDPTRPSRGRVPG